MRQSARRYQRAERKAAIHSQYMNTIPSLQGSDWEYMSHQGYVSLDESDDEGRLVTKRPESRAQWENNFVEAVYVAELEKARSRPGLCPRFPPRIINIVKRPIPQLDRGTGNARTLVQVTHCGISREWRENNLEEFKKYGHLINVKATMKPDISAFLAKYPTPSHDDDQGSIAANDHESDLDLLEGCGMGDQGRDEVDSAEKGHGGDDVSGKGGLDEEGRSGEGLVSTARNAIDGLGEHLAAGSQLPDNFLIDPQLRADGTHDHPTQSENQAQLPQMNPLPSIQGADNTRATTANASSSEPSVPQTDPAAHPSANRHDPFARPFEMPPPPVPEPTLIPGNANAIGNAPKKRGRQPKLAVVDSMGSNLAPAHDLSTVGAQPPDALLPRKRG
ncbi:hypothetical protein FRC08_009601 [Ceratobasidium sp. 394]|nr:hypothetical protein FRC08_009601 [Ceratobasidium sp. 394]